MKNTYAIIPLLIVMALGIISCEDGNKNYTDEFDSVFYYKNEGIKEFDFYTLNKDNVHTITIGRGGHSLTGRSIVTLEAFTNEELDNYNQSIEADYKLLEEDYYIYPSKVIFEEGEEYKNIDVVFKGKISNLANSGEYILPLRLTSDKGTINKNKDMIYFKPNIVVPCVIMEPAGLNSISFDEGQNQERNFELSFYLDVKNEWDLKLNLETDEEKLEEAVREYNQLMKVDYELLPPSCRDLESTILFQAGEGLVYSQAKIKDSGLLMGDYLFPIIPKSVSGMKFDVKKDICYIHVLVKGELNEITLTPDMLYTNSTNGGDVIGKVTDGNINSYWESIWGKAAGTPNHHPIYGVYIDVDLTKAGISVERQLTLNYATRTYANAVPHLLVIYAGTDESNLRKVGELTLTKNDLPTSGGKWTENIPHFSLGREKSTLIRISILQSSNGSLTMTEHPAGRDFPCVSMSELRLWGK